MDKLAQAPEFADKINFVLVNIRGKADAGTYKTQKGLSDILPHGGASAPAEYGLKYIPHKVIIDASGKVIKNFDGVDLPTDLPALLG